jgi:hypothetical protein
MCQKSFEEDRGAEIVDTDIAIDLVHALANANLCGEMHNLINALHSGSHGLRITDVSVDDLDRTENGVRWGRAAVDLLDETIEHANLIAFRQQCPAKMTANEPSTAGDQHSHAVFFPVRVSFTT